MLGYVTEYDHNFTFATVKGAPFLPLPYHLSLFWLRCPRHSPPLLSMTKVITGPDLSTGGRARDGAAVLDRRSLSQRRRP